MIRAMALPEGALLRAYVKDGHYTDCFATDLPVGVSQARYVEAFYTTALFKLERWILSWAVARPSTDAEARQLAAGARDAFAAWRVEDRRDDQLLMRDVFTHRTRSWLMTAPAGRGTRLYFGSAVVPKVDRDGSTSLGASFGLLLGFHTLYSRALLGAACRRLSR